MFTACIGILVKLHLILLAGENRHVRFENLPLGSYAAISERVDMGKNESLPLGVIDQHDICKGLKVFRDIGSEHSVVISPFATKRFLGNRESVARVPVYGRQDPVLIFVDTVVLDYINVSPSHLNFGNFTTTTTPTAQITLTASKPFTVGQPASNDLCEFAIQNVGTRSVISATLTPKAISTRGIVRKNFAFPVQGLPDKTVTVHLAFESHPRIRATTRALDIPGETGKMRVVLRSFQEEKISKIDSRVFEQATVQFSSKRSDGSMIHLVHLTDGIEKSAPTDVLIVHFNDKKTCNVPLKLHQHESSFRP